VSAYRIRRRAREERLSVRGLSMFVRRWGPPPALGESPLVLLHGWQDTGDTFQFLVDAFERDWPIVAPDWRGFGRSEWGRESYWFPDYFADLDALLDEVAPDRAACLVGHSMGGNIASTYAGVRPERVRALVNVEGVGLPRTRPEQAPGRLRRWLEEVRGTPASKRYDSVEELARVIDARFPRFGPQRARFVAAAWSEALDEGGVRLRGDARHRWVNPVLARREELEACWAQVRAPALMVLGADSDATRALGADGTPQALRALIPGLELVTVPHAGHMLHIETPEEVARLIERFLATALRTARADESETSSAS